MNANRQCLLISVISLLVTVCLHAQTPQRRQTAVPSEPDTSAGTSALEVAGTVTDSAGNPIAGATVEYWRYEGNVLQPGAARPEKQSATGADGGFDFKLPRDMGFLLVSKAGLAPVWTQVGEPMGGMAGAEKKLVMTPPGTLAGIVVDEADKPVANVEISVALALSETRLENGVRSLSFLMGKAARDTFSTRTDKAGRFQIDNFPTNARAFFAIQSSGKVLRSSPEEIADLEAAGYRAGQTGIKLVAQPAGSIEGTVVGPDAAQPLPVARLTLQPDEAQYFFSGLEPVQSGAGGTFRFDNVAAGSYRILAVFGTNTPPDWVAEAVPVSVETGQAVRGVQVMASRGALLEVSVLAKEDHKPLAKVNVSAYRRNSPSATVSDSNGIARLRLVPGDYQIAAIRPPLSSAQTSATVEAGRTNRVEIEIAAPRKISGIVRAPDGRAAAGIAVRMVGGFGPTASEVKTDENGRFELDWEPRRFGGGEIDATVCVLARDTEHNLAAAQDIDEDTRTLELKLEPALTLVGRAEAGGKPITNATAQLVFWTGRSGMWLRGLARTNTPGQYEIPALPPGRRYGVVVSAPGYGQKQLLNLDISDEPIRQQLDTVELLPANLTLAGQVLDADDKPVPGCYVNLNGDGQPNAHVRTDREGRFVFDHVCAGALRIQANGRNSFGSISAEGGDTNVVLRLGQTFAASPGATLHKLRGLVTDETGQPVAGAQVAVFPNEGVRWIKANPDGEYHLTWALQPWQTRSSAQLVARDPARNFAAIAELSEDATNLDVSLKPALTITGQVKGDGDKPLPGAQVGLWLRGGNTYYQLDPQLKTADAGGRFEIKCLPKEARYLVYASAKGYGRSQRQIEAGSDSNRLEMGPFVLKLADRVIAGQVLRDDEKPASGVNVQLNGEDQPNGYMPTDSKGRFHFRVCEGQIRLYAYSPSGGGTAQATVEAGDTNIVMYLSSSTGSSRPASHRVSLKGSQLPDLTALNLAADAAPAGRPVLLCLFDAAQRPSRHALHLLQQKAAALRDKNVAVLGVQVAVISDEDFNEWKDSQTVSFPVGRLTEISNKSKWASQVSAFPWLILANANHRVVEEGFSINELDAQLQKLGK